MQANEKFRQDLYYRLKSHHIAIPPLRERKADIPYLATHFVTKAAQELGKKRPAVPKELFTLLNNYHFPGNVRELQGMIFDAISLHRSGILSLESIRAQLDTGQAQHSQVDTPSQAGADEQLMLFPGRFPTLKEAEDLVIHEALKRAENNQAIAASLLGMSRRALNNRLRRKDKVEE
jgi:DNA-binding NtrC family response regulator